MHAFQKVNRIQYLVIFKYVVLHNRFASAAFAADFLAIFTAQVPRQVGLGGDDFAVCPGVSLKAHVRFNTLSLDRATAGRVIKCGGKFDGAILGNGNHGLDRAFAKTAGTHDDGALVVLQGAGDDFGS